MERSAWRVQQPSCTSEMLPDNDRFIIRHRGVPHCCLSHITSLGHAAGSFVTPHTPRRVAAPLRQVWQPEASHLAVVLVPLPSPAAAACPCCLPCCLPCCDAPASQLHTMPVLTQAWPRVGGTRGRMGPRSSQGACVLGDLALREGCVCCQGQTTAADPLSQCCCAASLPITAGAYVAGCGPGCSARSPRARSCASAAGCRQVGVGWGGVTVLKGERERRCVSSGLACCRLFTTACRLALLQTSAHRSWRVHGTRTLCR